MCIITMTIFSCYILARMYLMYSFQFILEQYL